MPWLWSGLDQELARWDCAQHPFFRRLGDRDRFTDYVGQFAYLAQARQDCITNASRRSGQHESSLAPLISTERHRAQRWAEEAASTTGTAAAARHDTELCVFAWNGQAALEAMGGTWKQLAVTSYVTATISASAARELVKHFPTSADLLAQCHEPPPADELKQLVAAIVDPYDLVNIGVAVLALRGFWVMLMDCASRSPGRPS